ncbi:hypothetical protein GUJ93_ZPchr0003g16716 [Zizania palustris]|uniref:Uncharacterized protein n=1 Tax=Zizania palustris TaxID=103762 RepID=A0A8J5RN73_ZIZPA|nr:hypothetical protein GUJ93_ZPchr0003g16716 [Zizania palustris]
MHIHVVIKRRHVRQYACMVVPYVLVLFTPVCIVPHKNINMYASFIINCISFILDSFLATHTKKMWDVCLIEEENYKIIIRKG